MKYKVGDVVKIRTDLKVEGEHLLEGKEEDAFSFNEEMKEEKGKKATIREVHDGFYSLTIDGEKSRWGWTKTMLECYQEPSMSDSSYWEELSKSALTDAEGELYHAFLDPILVSRHAAFTKSFWKKELIKPVEREIVLNENLSLKEVEELLDDKMRHYWDRISIERKLSIEEVIGFPIRTKFLFHENDCAANFTDDDIQLMYQKMRKEVEKGELEVNAQKLTRFYFPIDVIEKEWEKMSVHAKHYVSKYQPITFKFALSKKEEIENALLETTNIANTLTGAQHKQLRNHLSKIFDMKIQSGEMIDWEEMVKKYRFADWFLEKYRHEMGEETYQFFSEAIV